MLKNIKTTSKNKSFNLTDFFKSISLKTATGSPGRVFKNILSSMSPAAKTEIISWLKSVQSVKEDENLSRKEKEQKLDRLRPSGAVLTFFDSVIDVLISKVPIQNKTLLRTGVTGVSIAASFMNFRKAGIILLVLQQALPRFVLSRQFDDISDYLVKELKP